jgi:hypothetical protein
LGSLLELLGDEYTNTFGLDIRCTGLEFKKNGVSDKLKLVLCPFGILTKFLSSSKGNQFWAHGSMVMSAPALSVDRGQLSHRQHTISSRSDLRAQVRPRSSSASATHTWLRAGQ